MRRTMLTLVVFAGLSAWAGAQAPPAPLPAAVQVKQFKTNRLLIENLVFHGISLSRPDADNPVGRAVACGQTAQTLANYLNRAADDQDPDRVAELANLFGEVVRDGLVPNLVEARQTIGEKSPAWEGVKAAHAGADSALTEVRKALTTPGKVGDSDKVKAALQVLDPLTEAIKLKK